MSDTEKDAVWLDEFLFRGRPPGSDQPSGYHVKLGKMTTDASGEQHAIVSVALTEGQAKSVGFDLPELIAAINTAPIEQNKTLRADLDAMSAKHADVATDLSKLQQTHTDMCVRYKDADDRAAGAQDRIADLEKQADAYRAEIERLKSALAPTPTVPSLDA